MTGKTLVDCELDPIDRPLVYPFATKIPGKTSKICPSCGRRRRRIYLRRGPLRLSECDPSLEVHNPRVSWSSAWWNRGIIRALVAPPNPPADDRWYECKTYTHCRHCKARVLVHELSFRRQFGVLRELEFRFYIQRHRVTDIIFHPVESLSR